MFKWLKKTIIIFLIKCYPDRYLKWKKIGSHSLSKDKTFLHLYSILIKNSLAIQRIEEQYNLWSIAKSVATLKGNMAEVGVYTGGSTKILCEAKGETHLHLFDTFSGLPDTDTKKDGSFQKGDFADCSIETVKKLLSHYPNVHFHKGFFPSTTKPLNNKAIKFKFVHLDVDLYRSTHDALEWFYPRMVHGGIIITHDYGDLTVPGVKQAFDKFFSNKPEVVIPIWYSQAIIVKS
jgi:hypothetical protein